MRDSFCYIFNSIFRSIYKGYSQFLPLNHDIEACAQ